MTCFFKPTFSPNIIQSDTIVHQTRTQTPQINNSIPDFELNPSSFLPPKRHHVPKIILGADSPTHVVTFCFKYFFSYFFEFISSKINNSSFGSPSFVDIIPPSLLFKIKNSLGFTFLVINKA